MVRIVLIEIQLINALDVDKTVALVRDHAKPVSQVTGSSAELTVRYRTSQSEEELSQFLTQLVSTGIEVCQFREIPADLEDTFLSITREESPTL